MNIQEVMKSDNVDFSKTESSYFLIGLLSAFENRFQAVADHAMKEISWKQFFAIVCINLCKSSPTVKELAEIMGSSHQNVKQILLKLEKKGFVKITVDEKAKVSLVYCRGAWDEEKMTFGDRTLCKMLQKAVAKQNPEEYEPWQKALMSAVGEKCDWTDKKYLEPLIAFL